MARSWHWRCHFDKCESSGSLHEIYELWQTNAELNYHKHTNEQINNSKSENKNKNNSKAGKCKEGNAL